MKTKRKPTEKFLATMLYVSPEGTIPAGEKQPRVITYAKVDTLPKLLNWLRENFDGYETFTESFMPEVKTFFKENKKVSAVYRGDDYSAGQWFSLARVNKNGVSVEVNDGDE